jgi:HPt (histidine-containing phosphotransfer) domain-containing protein
MDKSVSGSEDPVIPEAQTFDPSVLAELRTALEDDEFVLGIAHNFLVRTPDHIAALTDSAREGDLEAIAKTAHLIKGSALTFGAPRLVDLCAALQMSPAEARSLVPAVAREFDELASALTSYLGDVRPQP